MKIKEIVNYNKNSQEADLIVSDGKFECLVFCHPSNYSKNDIITTPLYANLNQDFMLSRSIDVGFEKLHTFYFGYKIVAEVVDNKDGIVCVGNILIDVGMQIPGWAKKGDIVEFSCSRLDL